MGADKNVMEILAAGGTEYGIHYDGKRIARAYLSRVAGALFLKIQELEDERNFMVARVDFTGDDLRLRFLNDGVALLAGDPPRFRSELARRIDDPTFYYRGVLSLPWVRSDRR
jgi:hypothetical protein